MPDKLVESIAQWLPCPQAIKWLETGKYGTWKIAWHECQRFDWMLWLVRKCTGTAIRWSDKNRPCRLCALDCAEMVKGAWPEQYRWQIENAIRLFRRSIVFRSAEKDAAIEQLKDLFVLLYNLVGSNAKNAVGAICAAVDGYESSMRGSIHRANNAIGDGILVASMDAKCADIVRRHFPEPPDVAAWEKKKRKKKVKVQQEGQEDLLAVDDDEATEE